MRSLSLSLSSLYKSLALTSAVAGVLLAPGKAGGNSFGVSDACADGTCCPQDGAVCGLNGQNFVNHYLTGMGPCC